MKKTKKPKAKRGSARECSANVAGFLMVVDQKPFLKKALARCQRIQRDLAKSKKELAAFEEGDLLRYKSWFAAEFGALLTELRQLHEAVDQLELWLLQIDFAEVMVGVPVGDIYEYVRKHRDDPDYWDPRYDPDPSIEVDKAVNIEDEDAFDDMDDEERSYFEEFMKDLAEDCFGINSEELEQMPGFPGWSPGSVSHKAAITAGQKDELCELKQLYRRLARRLHPDVTRTDEFVARRRWEQLQAAYEAEDIDKLRALEAICDADETGLTIKLGLAHLNTWAEYHQLLLKPQQKAMREVRKHPAWGFSKIGERELRRLKKETREELEYEKDMLQLKRLDMEGVLESYRNKGERYARKTARKPTKKKAKPKQRPAKQAEPENSSAAKKQGEFEF